MAVEALPRGPKTPLIMLTGSLVSVARYNLTLSSSPGFLSIERSVLDLS